MTNLLFLGTALLFFVWIFRNALFWIALWQTKEYRFDRLLVHFKETENGKRLLFSWLSLLKWLVLFSYGFVVFIDGHLLFYYQLAVAAVYLLELGVIYKEVLRRRIKRPVFTMKAIVLLVLTIYFYGLFFMLPIFDRFVWMLLLDRLLVVLIGFFIFAFSIPTALYTDLIVDKAMKKLEAHRRLLGSGKGFLVIGITGSYGKSSTKEYVAQILSHGFAVLKTEGTNNTPIGIAKTILHGLKVNTEIFVAEMGAYKRGEIAELCQIAHPQIGVLTGINDQHLSLFGSIQNTMSGKYELIAALPYNGLALFNGNNAYVYDLWRSCTKKKVLYVTEEKKKEYKRLNTQQRFPVVSADAIVINKTNVEFDITLGKKRVHFISPVIGKQAIENMLPAIYLAHHLGMSPAAIKQAVSTLQPLAKTMTIKTVASKTTFVDDSYNANPDAIMAVLDYAQLYKGKRIMVLTPIIELGKNANATHYQLGKAIAQQCDYLFVTNKNYYDHIRKGVLDAKHNCVIYSNTPSYIASFIQKHTGKDDVVIFEGRDAGMVLAKLK